MNIAIDYDGTFSADPEMFATIIHIIKMNHHNPVIVTGRSDENGWGDEVRKAINGQAPIVFAGNKWKKIAAIEAGYSIHIWIDDFPEYIAPQEKALVNHKNGHEKSRNFLSRLFGFGSK